MSHFAELKDNIVQRVIVAEQDFIDSGVVGDSSNWIQTSYNTRGGVHYAPNSSNPDNGVALRKNYAGIGYTYDKTKDAFIAPQPYPSWLLDDETCQWNAPVPIPNDMAFQLYNAYSIMGKTYVWDEPTTSWIERDTTP